MKIRGCGRVPFAAVDHQTDTNGVTPVGYGTLYTAALITFRVFKLIMRSYVVYVAGIRRLFISE